MIIKQRVAVAGLFCSMLFLQAGCATETGAGATFGAVGGGLVAYARCKALGISTEDCRDDIAKGAVAGGALGALAGSRLQKRRVKGEKELAFIKRNNQELAQRNTRLEQQIVEARALVAEARKTRNLLKVSVASSSEKEKSIKSLQATAQQRQLKLKSAIKDNKIELKDQQVMLASIKKNASYGRDAVALEKEIAELKSQITDLEQTERELASISSTRF